MTAWVVADDKFSKAFRPQESGGPMHDDNGVSDEQAVKELDRRCNAVYLRNDRSALLKSWPTIFV
jgi:hypothetical protein